MTTQPTIKPRLGQIRAANVLSRLAGPTATDAETIMSGVDAEATPPLALSAANPASLVVNIGTATVTNPNTAVTNVPSPVQAELPNFTGGTVTFPASSGGNAVPSAGSNVAITIPSGDYLKVVLAVDNNANIVIIPGTPSSTVFLAALPTITRTDIYQAGYVVLQNVAGVIQNVAGSSIFQFKSGGGGGGGGGLVPNYQGFSFTAAAGNNYLVDTTTGGFTATLPAGSSSATIRFTDDAGTWGINNLVITPATGQNIQGLAANTSFTCDLSGAWVQLDWDSTNNYWVLSTGSAAGNTGLTQLSSRITSAGGQGEKNYVPATAQSTAATWAAVAGTGATTEATVVAATDVTPADLPRANTTKSGIKFTSTAASGGTPVAAFAYFPAFPLDAADYNKKLKVQFDQNALAGYTSGDYSIEVRCGTSSTFTTPTRTSGTLLPLSTDSSGATTLPALEGTFRTTFDAPGSATPYICIYFVPKTTAASSLVISDLIVGPGVVVQSAAVTGWTASTAPVGGWFKNGQTNMTVTVNEQRIGTSVVLDYFIQANGTSAAFTDFEVNLPSGYALDPSAIATNTNASLTLGKGDVTKSGVGWAGVWVTSDGSLNSLHVYSIDPTVAGTDFRHTMTNSSPFTWDTTTSATQMHFRTVALALSNWAGSGTVNIAQNDVTYYYSTGNTWGTTNSNAATSQGPGGVLGGTTTPAGNSFYYEFAPTSPIPAGATPVLQFSGDGVHWAPGGAGPTSGIIENLRNDGTNYIGAGLTLLSNGNLFVMFGKYAYGTSGAWNGTWYWRVAVGLPGQAVGFSIVQPGVAAGLVSASGVPGFTDGSNAVGSVVGQYTQSPSAGVAPTSSGGWITVAQLNNLPAGDWEVSGSIYFSIGSGSGLTAIGASISASTNSPNSYTGNADGITTGPTTSSFDPRIQVGPIRVNISSPQTIYLNAAAIYSALGTGAFTTGCVIKAWRRR